MANYVLVNNSTRLIHVPTGKGATETAAMIPGAVHKLEIAKENDTFFKATVTGVPGLDVFTEKKYEDYLANKSAAEAAMSGGLDDEPDAPASGETAPAVTGDKPTGWVS